MVERTTSEYKTQFETYRLFNTVFCFEDAIKAVNAVKAKYNGMLFIPPRY